MSRIMTQILDTAHAEAKFYDERSNVMFGSVIKDAHYNGLIKGARLGARLVMERLEGVREAIVFATMPLTSINPTAEDLRDTMINDDVKLRAALAELDAIKKEFER